LFRGEWRPSFDHRHHSTDFLEREYAPCFEDFSKAQAE
jgi:hypothetical protein